MPNLYLPRETVRAAKDLMVVLARTSKDKLLGSEPQDYLGEGCPAIHALSRACVMVANLMEMFPTDAPAAERWEALLELARQGQPPSVGEHAAKAAGA